MFSLLFQSAIMTATMALTASAAPQCNTNADCLSGFICGTSDFSGSSSDKVCVKIGTCNNKPDPQFPNLGPKCGDSIFCNVGGYCGEGYFTMGGERILSQVCVNAATGVKCAEPST
ncbi:hypothetical protein TGAM01_v200213 [Trichoderma gamsii]|uniref:Uncharacterized protein n=1 Tax=Trichoderma gamsii TaxID=398673 RepID=A0A2P5A2M4_9HYPO|nr:hypothetical protein TGAM01_v200213 [Trichoderma gamsii]PON30793.1 hypothetical protein TGAM01_v200213 [Trichoderma gamsii]